MDHFLIFLASSKSEGNFPSLRYDKIGVIQLVLPCIEKVWNFLMSGDYCISSFRSSRLIPSSDDAWLRGTCMKLTCSNSPIIWFVNFRYNFILLSFASYSLLICPITSFELFFKSTFLVPKDLAALSSVSIASYSTSLLMAGNWSYTPYFRMSPFREVMTIPTPPFFCTDNPSVWTVHNVDISYIFSSSNRVNSAIKSTNTWAFIAIWGLYSISN